MAKVPHGVEILPKISIAWVGCTNVTDDRQTTDDRHTDRRWHIANMNLSSRSLKKFYSTCFMAMSAPPTLCTGVPFQYLYRYWVSIPVQVLRRQYLYRYWDGIPDIQTSADRLFILSFIWVTWADSLTTHQLTSAGNNCHRVVQYRIRYCIYHNTGWAKTDRFEVCNSCIWWHRKTLHICFEIYNN